MNSWDQLGDESLFDTYGDFFSSLDNKQVHVKLEPADVVRSVS